MRTLKIVEGEPFSLEGELRAPVRDACRRVEAQLAPSFRMLEEAYGQFTVRGVVGTIAIRSGIVLDVQPKTEVGEDWIRAVLDLLVRRDRADVAGERRAAYASHRNLLDTIAAVYADRLGRALRRDGPILVMERQNAVLPMLKGKLLTTAWVRRATWEPQRFPVTFETLTADNDFSKGLAWVATLLGHGTSLLRTRGNLLHTAHALRPGAADVTYVGSHVALRRLPAQWAAYEPAWDVASSILSRRSLLGSVGSRFGVSIALEAWPLLERLMERAVRAAVRLAGERGWVLRAAPKHQTLLLNAADGYALKARRVVPDGRIVDSDKHLATLEAKYARISVADGPPREHVFQALSTAAACDSRLAILVYPDQFEPVWWDVKGFNGRPGHLTAIGLGLFTYRRGIGDKERGERLLDLLSGPLKGAAVGACAP